MLKKLKNWWNATGPYKSRIARLRAERQRLEPALNLGLPRVATKAEEDILNEELPNPTLPSASGINNNNTNNTKVWVIVGSILLLAGIATTIIVIRKRKGGGNG